MSSSTVDDYDEDYHASIDNVTPFLLPVGRVLVSSCIPPSEVDVICELIQQQASSHDRNSAIEEDYDGSSTVSTKCFATQRVEINKSCLPPGATGRVLIVQVNDEEMDTSLSSVDEEYLEAWKMELSNQIDSLLFSQNSPIQQPILLILEKYVNPNSVESTNHDEESERFEQMIISLVQEYELNQAINWSHDDPMEVVPNDPLRLQGHALIPTARYEVDGAWVDDMPTGQVTTKVWDTSSFVIWDNLISEDLRRRLLSTVLGGDGSSDESDWDDVTKGPNPSRWTEGGLIDLPSQIDDDNDGNVDDDVDRNHHLQAKPSLVSFGLTDEALDELCTEPPPTSFQEMEKILIQLFPDFIVSRLPEAVLGEYVTPITANAPVYGQTFAPHIDADPFFAPPSLWTDIYGRYPNRATGKPRFVSFLVYLNDEWQSDIWGAPTRFFDVASGTTVDVEARPGRVVIMDQDITHTVVAPLPAAGKRPRYSLVWKLILHPKQHNQDMRRSIVHPGWPEPIKIGSALR